MNTIEIQAHEVQARQLRLADLAAAAPTLPANAPDRHHLGYQEFGLSFHHALSIASHLERHGPQLAASAFALARPMFETLQRGWWFTLCATDAQAQHFLESDEFPVRSLSEISRAIELHAPFAGNGFSAILGRTSGPPITHSHTAECKLWLSIQIGLSSTLNLIQCEFWRFSKMQRRLLPLLPLACAGLAGSMMSRELTRFSKPCLRKR